MTTVKTSIYPNDYLYTRLKALADLERRSLNQQILMMLEEYLSHVEALEGNGRPYYLNRGKYNDQ